MECNTDQEDYGHATTSQLPYHSLDKKLTAYR